MSCDFSTYNQLRDVTRDKSGAAASACSSLETAQAALQDAQAAVLAAQEAKTAAYADWEAAERAENAEAKRLGIDPASPPPPIV